MLTCLDCASLCLFVASEKLQLMLVCILNISNGKWRFSFIFYFLGYYTKCISYNEKQQFTIKFESIIKFESKQHIFVLFYFLAPLPPHCGVCELGSYATDSIIANIVLQVIYYIHSCILLVFSVISIFRLTVSVWFMVGHDHGLGNLS